MTGFFSLLISLSAISLFPHVFAGKCDVELQPAPIETVAEYTRELTYRKINRSSSIRHELLTKTRQNLPRRYPHIILGGGPHGNTTSAVLTQYGSREPGLVIEKTEDLSGVFSRMGAATWLTSPDVYNPVPGSPIRVADLNFEHRPISTTQELGQAVTLAAEFSDDDYIFGAEVTKIRVIPKGGTTYDAILEMRDGSQVVTSKLILAPGMGAPRIPGLDPRGTALLSRLLAQRRARTLVQVFSDSNAASQTGKSFLSDFRGKRIAVVGGGGGAQAGVAVFAGEASPAVYAGDVLVRETLPQEVIWLGSPYANATEFREANTVPSLMGLGKRMEQGVIRNLKDAFFVGIREKHPGQKGAPLILTYRLGKEDNSPRAEVEADEVVLGTGYESSILSLFENPESVSTRTVLQGVPGVSVATPVATQILINGVALDLFLVGPGASLPLPEAEVQRTYAKLYQSMEILAPRTESFAKSQREPFDLIGLPAQKDSGLEVQQTWDLGTTNAKFAGGGSPEALRLLLRFRFEKVIKAYHFQAHVSFRFEKKKGKIEVRVIDAISDRIWNHLLESLRNDDDFIPILKLLLENGEVQLEPQTL